MISDYVFLRQVAKNKIPLDSTEKFVRVLSANWSHRDAVKPLIVAFLFILLVEIFFKINPGNFNHSNIIEAKVTVLSVMICAVIFFVSSMNNGLKAMKKLNERAPFFEEQKINAFITEFNDRNIPHSFLSRKAVELASDGHFDVQKYFLLLRIMHQEEGIDFVEAELEKVWEEWNAFELDDSRVVFMKSFQSPHGQNSKFYNEWSLDFDAHFEDMNKFNQEVYGKCYGL